MKILVIGGTGHIGSFLVPTLVKDGHEVVVVTSGRKPVPDTPVWHKVKYIKGNYKRSDPAWASLVAGVAAEAVVDIPGTDVPGTYAAAKRSCKHYVATGSVWMLGPTRQVPTPPEEQGPCPFDWYGMRWRELKETREQASRDGVAFTAVLPPNICGPGKVPIDCRGGRDVEAHKSHARGEAVTLFAGCNTLISPCDASDVAQGHAKALAARDRAAGEFFNVGPAYAMTVPRFVEAYGEIHGVRIPIEWVSREEFLTKIMPDVGASYHFTEHMAPDISKTRERLGYEPQWTPKEAMARAINWMKERQML
jgi:nucleoside-diphosphate-sugar epimerase